MTVRFLVRGIVQGVGFRYFVLRRARSLGISGWVRNLPDGSVEVLASGTGEQLASVEAWLNQGPASAKVAGVDKSYISDEIDKSNPFDIR